MRKYLAYLGEFKIVYLFFLLLIWSWGIFTATVYFQREAKQVLKLKSELIYQLQHPPTQDLSQYTTVPFLEVHQLQRLLKDAFQQEVRLCELSSFSRGERKWSMIALGQDEEVLLRKMHTFFDSLQGVWRLESLRFFPDQHFKQVSTEMILVQLHRPDLKTWASYRIREK